MLSSSELIDDDEEYEKKNFIEKQQHKSDL